ncbi:hypothetical protein CHY_0989 [Carboxydothermus hydrogenoformans Z-2901]|uniref:Uncharacterized protein n=1 Tax=Carboxydothermus hydrogenoformans (strain ATCC BAA-161 / DSM 6008 / Z-2901) TaxID=246194 RepID=Q3ADE8_CARHZ|nr:hypothetical protein CHY_0989 [Carboxydothermus hydrogenoformans Z-2901]
MTIFVIFYKLIFVKDFLEKFGKTGESRRRKAKGAKAGNRYASQLPGVGIKASLGRRFLFFLKAKISC